MSKDNGSSTKLNDAQTSAIVASVTIVVCFVVYWSAQIQSVMDMLKLAYG